MSGPPAAAGGRADFSRLRYAQVWEDADVLLAALDVQDGDTCVSIASGGENTLSLLAPGAGPERVVALDVSPAQLACLELKVAAFRALGHAEVLELLGSRPSRRRVRLYRSLRPGVSAACRDFWDGRERAIARGICGAGKFERYFRIFRRFVLPLIHGARDVRRLLDGGTRQQRERFFAEVWDTPRWRLLFRMFFSRRVLGRLGRDPSFFRYVEGDVAGLFAGRVRGGLVDLDPAENPYLRWICTGGHGAVLPHALRAENFERIRARLDRLSWRLCSVEEYLRSAPPRSVDRFNLSDLFEYVSAESHRAVLEDALRVGRPGGRLAYWNLLVPRRRPESLASALRPLDALAARLHAQDRTFFYGALVVEEIADR